MDDDVIFNNILPISIVLSLRKNTEATLFVDLWKFILIFWIVDFHNSLLMLIFPKKIIVDVDRLGKKVVINKGGGQKLGGRGWQAGNGGEKVVVGENDVEHEENVNY